MTTPTTEQSPVESPSAGTAFSTALSERLRFVLEGRVKGAMADMRGFHEQYENVGLCQAVICEILDEFRDTRPRFAIELGALGESLGETMDNLLALKSAKRFVSGLLQQ